MNEPVAYMMESPSAKWFLLEPDECLPNETCTPLYTHPVRELTDEEIKGVLALDECWIGEDSSMPNMIAFARAILKKASDK